MNLFFPDTCCLGNETAKFQALQVLYIVHFQSFISQVLHNL